MAIILDALPADDNISNLSLTQSAFVSSIIELTPSTKSGFFDCNPSNFDEPDFFEFLYRKNKRVFTCFIENRLNYLENLTNLPNNWINGSYQKPSSKTIQTSKDLLENIKTFSIDSNIFLDLRIAMSPTPEGEISIQLNYRDDLLVINIMESQLGFEICKNGLFSDLNPANIYSTSDIVKRLDRLING